MKSICHICCGKFAEECHNVVMNKKNECLKNKKQLKTERKEINENILENIQHDGGRHRAGKTARDHAAHRQTRNQQNKLERAEWQKNHKPNEGLASFWYYSLFPSSEESTATVSIWFKTLPHHAISRRKLASLTPDCRDKVFYFYVPIINGCCFFCLEIPSGSP